MFYDQIIRLTLRMMERMVNSIIIINLNKIIENVPQCEIVPYPHCQLEKYPSNSNRGEGIL